MAKFKTDRISDWRREQAIDMRYNKKMTYQQIADSMGVSKAYIGVLLKDTVKNPRFQLVRKEAIPFPGLMNWMNDNQVTQYELARRMGYGATGGNYQYLTQKIKKGNLKKQDIDKLISVTGLSYEALFGGTA